MYSVIISPGLGRLISHSYPSVLLVIKQTDSPNAKWKDCTQHSTQRFLGGYKGNWDNTNENKARISSEGDFDVLARNHRDQKYKVSRLLGKDFDCL